MAAALVSASLASTPLPASSDATRKSNRFAYGLQFSKKNELRLSHGHGRRWSSVTFVAKSSEDESSSTANTLVDQSKTDSAQTATTTTEEVNASEKPEASADQSKEDKTQQQETDWKVDEDFKNFMGNPSIEAAVKLEKQRAERRLKELDNEASGNIFKNFFTSIVKSTVAKEKERLEKAVETFKLKSCFGYDTFFAVDCRRFGDGGIFIGNLRRPIEEVIPKLEKKLADAAGREVVLWFMEEQVNDMKKQVCMVQPKSEIYLQFEATKLSTRWGYISAILLGVATFGTIALVSGFFLKPDATFDDYVANVLPLFGGFVTILGASEVLTLTIVSVGVAIATVTDLQFHLFGAFIALAWISPSAVNKILWSNLQQQDNWTALALMWKTTPITFFSLVALTPWLDPPGLLAFNWNLSNTIAILMSATLGFLLQWSGALALGATSATTHVVLGQFKTCIILLGGFLIFHSNPGLSSLCGAIVALGAMTIYTYLNLQEAHEPVGKQATLRQNSFSSLKTKLSKANGDDHAGNESVESV